MDNLQSIRAHLHRRDSRFLFKTYSQLALGILVSFFAPLAIMFFAWIICWLWKWNCPLWLFFIGGAAITLPFLYRLELAAQGGALRHVADTFNAAASAKEEPPSFKHVGVLGTEINRDRTPVSGVVESFLIGPRLVVAALRKRRLRAVSQDVNQDRVTSILDSLNRLDSGAATEKMLGPNEPPEQLSKVLAYLLFFDWIGIAGDGSKVWLLTESRRELAQKPE
jgi:hypothetical protein